MGEAPFFGDEVHRAAFEFGDLPDWWTVRRTSTRAEYDAGDDVDPPMTEADLGHWGWTLRRTWSLEEPTASEVARWLCDQRREIEETAAHIP